MQRVEIHLNDEERDYLEILSSTGVCQVRVLQRAQVLLALDKGVLDRTESVLGLSRQGYSFQLQGKQKTIFSLDPNRRLRLHGFSTFDRFYHLTKRETSFEWYQ